MTIQALTLTDPERAAILAYWDTPEDFIAWQRDALAAEIMRRAQTAAQTQARQIMDDTTAGVVEDFPTLFPVEEQPAEEAPPVDTPVAEAETP